MSIAKEHSTSTTVVPANRFLTPAGQIDFPDDPVKQDQLNTLWNTNLNGFVAQGINGNPWTATYSSNQTYYYNPTTTDTTNAVYSQILWSPLPGRITYYFHQLANTFDLFSLADTGYDTKGNTFGQITNDPCNPSEGTNEPYGPYGPRGWQDEYCEWSIERNDKGQIVRIDYTCENPEYFNSVWMIDPQRVLEIYQQTLDKPQIKLEDLYLLDGSGNAVIDPSTGRPAYNPLNKWNSGTSSTSTSGGAMHLTSTPNTIQTEVGLGSTATTPRVSGNTNENTLICCGQFGQIGRNSDPHIGGRVNVIVNSMQGVSPALATLANPSGLYIQQPNFAMFTDQNGIAIPEASTFWQVKRGTSTLSDSFGRPLPGTFALHATLMVPESLGYTISDIYINGVQVQYASQINQTFDMQIVGQAIPLTTPPPAAQPCAGSPATPLAQPLQLFHQAVFEGMYAQNYTTVVGVEANLTSNSTLIAPWVAPGASNVPMVLVLGGVDPNTPPSISFGDENISVTVVSTSLTPVTYAIPGNTYPSVNYAMNILVSVSASAPAGLRGVLATNPGQEPSVAMPALLNVVSA